jgi:hypothetical protein
MGERRARAGNVNALHEGSRAEGAWHKERVVECRGRRNGSQ